MRSEFIKFVYQPEISMAEACRTFNISRKTGYKWLRRYEKDGDSGVANQSRKPVNQPTKLSENVLLRIVRMHKDMKSELQAERADTQAEMDEWVRV